MSKSRGGVFFGLLSVILVLTNVASLGYFFYYEPHVPQSDVPLEIQNISENSEDYLGKPVTASGYYVQAAGNHMLVLEPGYYFNNSLGTDNHLLISGDVPDDMEDYLGMRCSVKGILGIADEDEGTLGVQFESFTGSRVTPIDKGIYQDAIMNPYPQFDQIELLPLVSNKYAVLYSGGINENKAYSRYWNDIIYMYFILLMRGYDPDNIYVVYKDGVGEDTYTPVHYPATHASMNTVFNELEGKMTSRDKLFFYTTNHGGSGGISVWNPMDSSGALTHTEVSDWLDALSYWQMIIVMEQCVSGKFISYLSGTNRVILTACKDDESSWACDDEGNWDEFVYHFMCALVGFPWNADGSTVDADFDNNSQISMYEAFIWAALKDSRDETPWYDDDGDGIGVSVIYAIYGPGPFYGNSVYL